MTEAPAPARTAGRHRDERTDSALIDAVLDLVAGGATLSGLSFVAIAEHAGVSRNSLYRRWKTKDALYLDALASLGRSTMPFAGVDVRDDIVELLTALVERALDPRASQMLRALSAEARTFPQLHRRYFEEVVAPRRAVLLGLIQRGIDTGEVAAGTDVSLAADLLVDPIIAQSFAGTTDGLDPETTGRRIVDLVFSGLSPRAPRSAATDRTS